jgi:hypothetical protein
MRVLAPVGGNLRREVERFFDRFVEPTWEPYEAVTGE